MQNSIMRRCTLPVIFSSLFFLTKSVYATPQAKECGYQESNPCYQDTVVVGGGFSGMVAAYELNKKGVDVNVYEARNRLGGKVKSITKKGIVLEEGGLFINSDHEYYHSYLKELNLETIDKTTPQYPGYKVTKTYVKDRKIFSLTEFYEYFKPIADFIVSKPFTTEELDKLTCYDLVHKAPGVSKKLKQEFLNYADLLISAEYGENLEDINANIFYDLMSWDKDKKHFIVDGQLGDERYRVKGGNDSVVKAFAKTLPTENIHLNHRLRSVYHRDNGRYKLKFSYFNQPYYVESDYLVLAAPINLYHVVNDKTPSVDTAINLDIKNLPETTKQATKHVTFGSNFKLILLFKGDVWIDKDKKLEYSQVLTEQYNGWNAGKGSYNGYSAITLFISGRSAKKTYTPAEAYAMAKDYIYEVGSVLPNATLENLVEVFPAAHWPTNPYSYGSYTGSFNKELYGELSRWISMPELGRLVFTGSDWSQSEGGFMDGALEMGKKSAEYLLKQRQQVSLGLN